jgi:hypothetical protein
VRVEAAGTWRPDQSALRVARTGLLGLAAAVLAAVAHTASGAAAPSPALVLAAGTLAAAACWRASRRRLGALRCATVSAAVQAVLHLTFAASAPSSGHDGIGMLAAHVAAGAAFGVWLAVGEAALWRAAARLAAATAAAVRHLARRFTRLLTPPTAAGGRAPAQRALPRRRRAPRPALRHAVVRRGPPPAAAGA